jgi:hypothetical protein
MHTDNVKIYTLYQMYTCIVPAHRQQWARLRFTADSHAAKGGAMEIENGYTGNSYP